MLIEIEGAEQEEEQDEGAQDDSWQQAGVQDGKKRVLFNGTVGNYYQDATIQFPLG